MNADAYSLGLNVSIPEGHLHPVDVFAMHISLFVTPGIKEESS